MKTTNLIVTAVISAGLAFNAAAQAKEHEEETIAQSAVPAAVQKTAEAAAKGGKILKWEKEEGNYEVGIEKDGKKWEIKMDATGKVLKKHDESNEKEEHEKK
jgi:uncharacterized membrane protein YkoI